MIPPPNYLKTPSPHDPLPHNFINPSPIVPSSTHTDLALASALTAIVGALPTHQGSALQHAPPLALPHFPPSLLSSLPLPPSLPSIPPPEIPHLSTSSSASWQGAMVYTAALSTLPSLLHARCFPSLYPPFPPLLPFVAPLPSASWQGRGATECTSPSPGESPPPKLLSNFLLISYHNEIISVPLAPFTIFPTPLTSSHPTHLLPPHSPPPTPLTSSHPTHLLPPHSPPPIPLISSHPTHLLPPHSPPPIPLISSHPTHLLPPHSSPPTPLISSHRTHLLPPHSTPSTPLTSSHPNHLLPPHSSPPKPLTSSHPNHLLPPHSPPPTPLTSSNSAPSILPTLSNRQLLILSTLPCYAHHLTSSQMLSSVQQAAALLSSHLQAASFPLFHITYTDVLSPSPPPSPPSPWPTPVLFGQNICLPTLALNLPSAAPSSAMPSP
ncbi:unnamed protein product [Closterium sp. NIES-64]|nr:unnamed protein product [Closterium sp. NIES-64]